MALGGITPAAAQSTGLSESFLEGSWNEQFFCGGPEVFAFDGKGNARQGASTMNYRITGPNEVLFYGPGGSVPIQARMNSNAAMDVTLGGTTGILYRCGTFAAPQTGSTASAPSSSSSSSAGSGGGGSAAAGVAALAILGGLAALAGGGKRSRGSTAPSAGYAGGAPALSPAFMTGRWTDNGNCSDAMTFVGNGDLITPVGGRANWAISGNELVVAGAGGTVRAQLRPISNDSIESLSGGTRSVMVRCP